MAHELDQVGQPLRRYPAHWSAAALAVGGALAVQLAWPEIWPRRPHDSWWPADALLIVAVTVYLLALAEIHVRSARWRPNELVPRIWLLGRTVAANVALAVYFTVVYVRGPQDSLMRAGLGVIPPTMLIVLAASAVVIGLAFRDGWRRFASDVPPAEAPYGKIRRDLLHMAAAVILWVLLLVMDGSEPDIKPWEHARPRPTGTSGRGLDHVPPTTTNWAGEPSGLVISTFSSGSGRSLTCTRSVNACLPADSSRSIRFAPSNGSASSQA